MDENDRRRFNRDENDYYTNNDRRLPQFGNGRQSNMIPPRPMPPLTQRQNYFNADAARGSQPVRQDSFRQPPQYGQPAQRPQGYNVPERNYPQGGYGAPDGYAPAQPQYMPQQQYGQQNRPVQFVPPQPEQNYSYQDIQAQPYQEKKKKGFFGFGKQKKEEFDPYNLGNVVITEPKTYDDVKVIIDGLRKRQAIIIDLSKVANKDAQRILDYLSGAIYALGGAQQRISDNMFLFTPEGVMIQGPASLRNKFNR